MNIDVIRLNTFTNIADGVNRGKSQDGNWMRPFLMTDSRKGVGVYDWALNVRSPIGSVMASFKEHGTQYDAMGSQHIGQYSIIRLQTEIFRPLQNISLKIHATIDLSVPI